MGSIANIIGIPVALAGIWLAYKQIVKTRKASEAAESAVRDFRKDLSSTTCLSDLSRALAGIDELKRLIRTKSYISLPDRFSEVRQVLIAVRGTSSNLSPDEQIIFQDFISELRELENRFAGYITSNSSPRMPSKMNDQLAKKSDSLYAILVRLRNQIGAHLDDNRI